MTEGPVVALPAGLTEDGLPVGFQVMAPPLADDRVYRVGAALERALVERDGGVLTDQLAPRWVTQRRTADATAGEDQ